MAVSDSWCMGGGESDGGAWCVPNTLDNPDAGPLVVWQCVEGCTQSASTCSPAFICAASVPANVPSCEPDCTAPSACASDGGCLTSLGCFNLTCDATTHVCR
jgi:hypothetical protein